MTRARASTASRSPGPTVRRRSSAVAPRTVPFDADVGPDLAMRPTVVYSRCERERPRRDCDIYRYSIARGVE